jgi:hypothetical protein
MVGGSDADLFTNFHGPDGSSIRRPKLALKLAGHKRFADSADIRIV